MGTVVNDYQLKDYEQARSLADAVYTNATNIKNIFEDINSTMDMLYNTNWMSDGANAAQAQYFKDFKAKFDPFYETVVDTKESIYASAAAYEAGDSQASQQIGGV